MLRIALIIPRFHRMSSKVQIRRGVVSHSAFPSPEPLAADGVVHHAATPTLQVGFQEPSRPSTFCPHTQGVRAPAWLVVRPWDGEAFPLDAPICW